jgi:DNA-binding transcriptional regulator YhcF (GntR family)
MEKKVQTSWGFFISPNSIFDVAELNTYEKICYLYLCRCSDSEKKSFPSYEKIGEKTGVSRRTAMRAVKSLEEKGYVVVKRRTNNKKKNTSNLYTILSPEEVTSDSQTPEQDFVVTNSHHLSSDSQSPSVVTHSHPINTHLINTHIINTQQQTEHVVVREKYESLFQKKLTKKQAEDLITLADKHQVDLIKKMENTYDIHRVEPRKSIVAAIKYAIVNGDWEIASSTVLNPKPLPKAVAEQLKGKRGQQELTREQLEAKKLEIQRKIAMLEEEIADGF